MREMLGWLILLAFAGCGSAKPGESCDDPECLNGSTALACDSGIYREVPCRGPQGCTSTSNGDGVFIECDETTDVAGDQCAAEDVGSIICQNEPNALECESGTEVWTSVTCSTTCQSGVDGSGVCM